MATDDLVTRAPEHGAVGSVDDAVCVVTRHDRHRFGGGIDDEPVVLESPFGRDTLADIAHEKQDTRWGVCAIGHRRDRELKRASEPIDLEAAEFTCGEHAVDVGAQEPGRDVIRERGPDNSLLGLGAQQAHRRATVERKDGVAAVDDECCLGGRRHERACEALASADDVVFA